METDPPKIVIVNGAQGAEPLAIVHPNGGSS
jgi:hypothetical protein